MCRLSAALCHAALELLWPSRCPLCEGWMLDAGPPLPGGPELPRSAVLHLRCLADLPEASSSHRLAIPRCPRRTPVHFRWRDSAAFFRLLHAVKYEGRVELAGPLAEEFARWAATRLTMDAPLVVVPMPDDPRRLRERGHSLNLQLARGVSRACGLGCLPGALVRRRPAPPLASLREPEERKRALQGIFGVGRLAELPRGRAVVLVEDQVTTGATVAAATRLLRARGHPALVLALAGASRAPREVGT